MEEGEDDDIYAPDERAAPARDITSDNSNISRAGNDEDEEEGEEVEEEEEEEESDSVGANVDLFLAIFLTSLS